MGNHGLYMVDGDGSGLRHLLSQSVQEVAFSPTWSPDGTRLAYITTPYTGRKYAMEVWTMNANGTGRVRLYETGCCGEGSWAGPEWSPDGRALAFFVSGAPVGGSYVMVIGTDGTGLHRVPGFDFEGSPYLQRSPSRFGDPVWKPAG
jgi:Tol biopolymer transport system component